MKTRILLPIMAMLIAAGAVMKAQDNPPEYLGLPGDNLNLYAVMKIFQESKTLEAFEKSLNDPNNKINNLDLNGDNYVDYIMVIDNVSGDVHNIVLRVAINQNESQDVAVFTVQRLANGGVQIQLTGDVALYGKNYIIEPIYGEDVVGTPNPGYAGDNVVVYGRRVNVIRTSPVVIASWPIISYIYMSDYIPWYSHWYWDYYPTWWHPWRPCFWHYYYGYHYNWYNDYYCHYRRWDTHRYAHWDDHYYHGSRVYSPVVARNINTGHYRNTYSHPESRKEGEDAYYRNNPNQGRRSTYSTVSNTSARNNDVRNDNVNNGRRVPASNVTNNSSSANRSGASTASQTRNNELRSSNAARGYSTIKDANAGDARRISGSVTGRSVSTGRSVQNTVSDSRPSVQSNSRPSTQSNSRNLGDYRSSQSAGLNNRSTYQSAVRNESRPERSQTISSGRSSYRPSTAGVNRSVSRPSQSQSVSSGRSSGQSHSVSAAPSRGSSSSGNSGRSVSKSSSSGKSESGGGSRRR